jgi:type I restriction enzyme S subunit
MVKLGEVFKLTSGKFLPQKDQIPGEYLVYGGNGVTGKHNEYFLEQPTLVIGRVGEYCGAVHITEPKSWVTDNALFVSEYLMDVELKYLRNALTVLEINKYAKRGGQPSISQSTVYDLSIPLPPIEVQQKIVAKIEAERKVIDGCRELIKTYEDKIKRVIDKVWED